MRITASIVTHRTDARELRRCTECVLRCKALTRLDIIDNSPDDALRSAVSNERVHYRHVENRGYGAGHNIAMREALKAHTDCHLVLNADTFWEGDVITPMAEYMASHSNVGIMMPKVYYPDGALQLTARRLPSPFDLLVKRFLPHKLGQRRMSRFLLERADHDKIINAPFLPGSFLLMRREALEAEGLFDERFFMYPEDIDITRRLHRRWLTLHYPAVSIEHCHAPQPPHAPHSFRQHDSLFQQMGLAARPRTPRHEPAPRGRNAPSAARRSHPAQPRLMPSPPPLTASCHFTQPRKMNTN